jgi:HEAT repeat protein
MALIADSRDIEKWVEQLRGHAQPERLKAASELGQLGVRTRGGVRVRGSLSESAKARMEREQINVVMQALSDADADIRREVAFALGEWADDVAVKVLSELAQQDTALQVRVAAVSALSQIGGEEAVESLKRIAREDQHDEARAAAISGLGELASANASPATKEDEAVD